MSPDTIVPNPANPQSFNRYSYVLNSPINFNDPSGHCENNPSSGDDYDNDYACWEKAYELRDLWGINLDLLGLLNLEQLQFFDQSLSHIAGSETTTAEQIASLLNESVLAHDLIEKMQPGGWDVIGVHIPGGVSAFLGIEGAFDVLFNFSGLEASILFGIDVTAGPQAGLSGGGGVFLGYNAPTNEAFAGWSSLISGTVAAGGGLTGEFGISGKIFFLNSFLPQHQPNLSRDPYYLAVSITPGVDVGFGVGAGYSWILGSLEYTAP